MSDWLVTVKRSVDGIGFLNTVVIKANSRASAISKAKKHGILIWIETKRQFKYAA